MMSRAGLVSLIYAAVLSGDAFAQAETEQLGRARIESLKEIHKTYDVTTTPSRPAELSKRPEANDGPSKAKKSPRPTIIQGPGYNKGIFAPSR